jgi:1-acyl-sn-glycerol-3-phosphate acyltransferase
MDKCFKIGIGFCLAVVNMIQVSLLPVSWSQWIFGHMFSLFVSLLNTKIRVHGSNRLICTNTLILANHYNGLDFVFLFYLFHRQHTPLYTLVKSDIVGATQDQNILSTAMSFCKESFVRSLYFIPYKRGDKEDGKRIKDCIVKTLSCGNNLLLFPEGTTHRGGIPKDFRHGIFELAIEKNLTILPVTIKYEKDIGEEREDPVVFWKWFDNEVDIYIHEPISACQEMQCVELKEKVKTIICGPFF